MSAPSFDFTGKTVFVAGGTSGINQGIAEAFGRAGASVAVFSRSQDKVDAAVARLEALGAPAFGAAGDVRQPEAVEAALERIEGRSYGECEDCGKAIRKTRLKAIPYTPLCIQCASKREQ